MVARIKPSDSLRYTLNYNENKVKEKVANLIHAVNYPKDLDKLTFMDKLNRLKKLTDLNPRVTKNSIHISLNFDPSEKDKLTHDLYRAIAEKYMQGIGYGNQPYLVYEHLDSGHPHLHIVTTNVQANGVRIASNNIGRNESSHIRKAIEKEFGLVEAEKQTQAGEFKLLPVNASKLIYGKGETKKELQVRLEILLSTYKYTSLSELNALLRLYNIVADLGKEGSRTHQHRGLMYRVLDEQGKPKGVGIKASSFYFKPTLTYLEQRMAENNAITNKKEKRIRNAIELAFQRQNIRSLCEFKTALQKDNIAVHYWKNDNGQIYGITYIDHETKRVINGRPLGKGYTANAIQNRLHASSIKLHPAPKQEVPILYHPDISNLKPLSELFKQTVYAIAAELQAEEHAGSIAYELRENERRRKRKRLRH